MTISELGQIISAIPVGGNYTLSAANFHSFGLVEFMLEQSFGVKSLALHSVKTNPDDLFFEGTARSLRCLGADCHDIPVQFKFEQKGDQILLYAQLNPGSGNNLISWIKDHLKLKAGALTFVGESCSKPDQYTFQTGFDMTWDTYRMTARLCELDDSSWIMECVKSDKEGSSELTLSMILGLMGIAHSCDLIPEQIHTLIKALSVNRLLVGFDIKENTYTSFRTEVTFLEHEPWEIIKHLKIGKIYLNIQVELTGDKSTVTLFFGGTATIGQTCIPVAVIVSQDDCSIMIGDTEHVKLPSLADLANFTFGEVKLNAMLPDGYNHGDLYLDQLHLVLGGCNSCSIQEFGLSLSFLGDWKLFGGILTIEQVGLFCRYRQSGNDTSFSLSGLLRISKIEFGLIITKDKVFHINGYLSDPDQEISLSSLFENVASMMGFGKITLPEFGLSGLSFECTPQQNQYKFSCHTYIRKNSNDFLNFESISADLSLCCSKENGKWNYSGCIKDGKVKIFSSQFLINYTFGGQDNTLKLDWSAGQPGQFSLEEFLHVLGLHDIAIPEFLNLTIDKIGLDYDLNSKEFKLNITTIDDNKLIVKSMVINNKREFLLASTIRFEAGLSSLPLLESIPQLGKVKLCNLKMVISSCDMEDGIPDVLDKMQIKSGLYLMSSLTLPDHTVPLVLPLTSKGKKHGNASGNTEGRCSLPIHKKLGPFSFEELHMSMTDQCLWFGLDASFMQGGLNLGLNGLSVGYKLREKIPNFKLDGLSVSLSSATMSVGGSLLRQGKFEYNGSLLVKLSTFSLSLFGSYAGAEGDRPSSSFAFGVLKAAIGGPPCFFVTGIAAGFGYNRKLVIPRIDNLDKFCLMRAMSDWKDPEEIFKHEKEEFPVQPGNCWVAAGVLATSFKMVDVSVLLTVLFGNNFELNLLGRAALDVPYQQNKKTDPIAHVILLIKAAIRPSQGVVSVEGVLSNDSYVLSHDCHLTGGFAFYVWYAHEHAGDFVITLGGFHNKYHKPDHYPTPERLCLNWRITDNLTVKGNLYFALTPSCIMAGGWLNLTFTSKVVTAWLDAHLDLLISWQPYRYDIAIGVSIGVKVSLWFIKFTFELGCQLHIWGPEFSGIAQVKLWFIEFSIPFGSDSSSPSKYIDTGCFIESFLPPPSHKKIGNEQTAYAGCSIAWTSGLVKEYDTGAGRTIRVACAEALAVTTRSTVPSSSATFNSVNRKFSAMTPPVLRPCGNKRLDSRHCVSFRRKKGDEVPTNHFTVEEVWEQTPSALWANESYPGETIQMCTGLRIAITPAQYRSRDYTIKPFEERDQRAVDLVPVLPTQHYDQEKSYDYVSHISDADVSERRRRILNGLNGELFCIDIHGFEDPRTIFCAKPVIKTMGGAS